MCILFPELLFGAEESHATAITIESDTTTPTPSSKVFACLYSTLNERWAVASRRRTLISYVLPQAESYPISPRQTESYPNITEAYSRQTESHPSQTELCSSRTEAHPLPDLNPAI
ncbi:GL13967 [Drosophila persimilis]|uniref:GL13967 n=1 Tax=Drosophila persimilis TaxID=7234 RepID=B4GQR2_DROPE|nr:GL13967 [Drosophila persimilis]